MGDTTSLDDLPMRGMGGGPPALDALDADEAARRAPQPPPQPAEPSAVREDNAAPNNMRLDIDVDPSVMNKVATDIRAHAERQTGSGATLPLPERDIPSEPHMQSLLHDSASSPNYVPPASAARAAAAGESAGSVLDRLRRGSKREASVDALFDDFKGLIFLAVVYYAFQTPYAHALLKRLFTFGYNEDGTTNQMGLFVGCVAFSATIFALNHVQARVTELLG